MSFIFTPLASDNFQRPDENPLANPPWIPDSFSDPSCQIVSHLCETSDGGSSSYSFYNGIVTPADQYVDITIGALANGASCGSLIRNDISDVTVGYDFSVTGAFGSSNLIELYDNNLGNDILNLPNQTVNLGDVFRVGFIGTTWVVYQNGVLIGTGTSSTTTDAGITGVFLSPTGSVVSNSGISKFVVGSMSQSGGGGGGTSGDWLTVNVDNMLRGSHSH